MATPSVPLIIEIAYLKSPTQKPNDAICAGELVRQKAKKVKKIDTEGDNFIYTGTRPR